MHVCTECGCVWVGAEHEDDPDEARTCPQCGVVAGSEVAVDE
jgi:predicted  nucleic acid-binding Zn-ribbon protein